MAQPKVLELGASPDATRIAGNVHADANHEHNNATTTFWRAAEGLSISRPGHDAVGGFAAADVCRWRDMEEDRTCPSAKGSVTPAFTISSLNFPIAASNSLLGITPASESLFALTIAMNPRIACALSWSFSLVSASLV
jgi:hypothetical protein